MNTTQTLTRALLDSWMLHPFLSCSASSLLCYWSGFSRILKTITKVNCWFTLPRGVRLNKSRREVRFLCFLSVIWLSSPPFFDACCLLLVLHAGCWIPKHSQLLLVSGHNGPWPLFRFLNFFNNNDVGIFLKTFCIYMLCYVEYLYLVFYSLTYWLSSQHTSHYYLLFSPCILTLFLPFNRCSS